MKRFFLVFSAALFGLLLASCSQTTIDNLDRFDEFSIPAADVLPSQEQLKGGKAKVVIFDLKNSDKVSERIGTGRIITSKLVEVVSQANADVIDRNSSSVMVDEIRLSQEKGVDYEGPEVAEYVIDGRVLQTTFQVTYNPPRKYKDIDGQVVVSEPSCTYRGTVGGDYKLYKLPSNKILKKFSFNDTETETVAATEANVSAGQALISGLFSGRTPSECKPNQGLTDGLINDAANESIRKSRLEIQNFFSPKGYITNMYELDDVYLAKVNVGSNNGLVQDQPVKIYTIRYTTNALTGEQNEEPRVIARGWVTNRISSDNAYILIEENAKRIRLGDFVRIEFTKSGFESFSDMDWLN